MNSRKPRSTSKSSKRAAPGSPPLLRRPRDEVESRRLAAQARAEEAERAAAEPVEEMAPAPRPGRSPAAPQLGRFVAGPATKRPLRELGKEELRALLLEVRANTRVMLGRLDATFARQSQRPIDEELLRRLVDQHGLRDEFVRVERENLRALLRQNRGFEAPIRRVLGISAADLRRQIKGYGLADEVLELKERTREEARAEVPLLSRLQLATSRADQLRDAGVLQELDDRNLPELEEALEEAAPGSTGEPEVLLELGRRALAIDPSLWKKVVSHYRLDALAARLLGLPPPPPAPSKRGPPPARGEGPGFRRDPSSARTTGRSEPPARGRSGQRDGALRRPPPKGGRSR